MLPHFKSGMTFRVGCVSTILALMLTGCGGGTAGSFSGGGTSGGTTGGTTGGNQGGRAEFLRTSQ